jgi:MFS transporter, DHA1 family, inner membrane transport protein
VIDAIASRGLRRPGLGSVFVLAIGTFVTGTDAFIVAGLLPSIAGSLDSSTAIAGQLVTAFAVAYALGSPILTTATATWSRRPILIGSLLAFALVNMVAAASPSMAVLAAARVFAGLVAGVFVPAASASATCLVEPSMRGRALAMVLGGTALATVLGVPIGLYAADLAGWRGAFLFVAAMAVAAAAAIAVLLPPIATPGRLPLARRLAMLRRRDVLSVLLVTVCANAGGFSVYTYLAPLFDGLGGRGTLQALIFTFGVAAAIGSYLSGHGSDRWGAVPVLVVILAAFTVNHVLLAVWTGALATSLLYVAVWGFTGWGTVPPQQHRLVERAGPGASIALSLNASAIYLGVALGGLLGGYVVDTAGAAWLWLPASACGALALLLLPVSMAAERRAGTA